MVAQVHEGTACLCCPGFDGRQQVFDRGTREKGEALAYHRQSVGVGASELGEFEDRFVQFLDALVRHPASVGGVEGLDAMERVFAVVHRKQLPLADRGSEP